LLVPLKVNVTVGKNWLGAGGVGVMSLFSQQ